MAEIKHTPGPWTVFTDNSSRDRDEGRFGPADGFQPIGGCGCCGSPWIEGESGEQVEANARLIAVAPELLALVREALAKGLLAGAMKHDAKALIAKATGGDDA